MSVDWDKSPGRVVIAGRAVRLVQGTEKIRLKKGGNPRAGGIERTGRGMAGWHPG
jgi:hypothetical protein